MSKESDVWRRLKSWWSNFLRKISWLGMALAEFIINIFVSTAPFYIAILVLMVSSKMNLELNEALARVIANGELVIYSATLMAPLMYALIKDPPIRFKPAFVIAGVALMLSGVATYVTGMLDGFSPRITTFSLACFAFSVFVYFMMIIFQHHIDSKKNAPRIQADKVAHALEEYRKHREVKP